MKSSQILLAFAAIASCNAFAPIHHPPITVVDTTIATTDSSRSTLDFGHSSLVQLASAAAIGEQKQTKAQFLDTLNKPFDLNKGSEAQTQLLNDVLEARGGLANPGSQESFASVASGVWRVVYAPHMTTMAGIVRGEFSVQYDLKEDGTIISHAKYNFPLFNLYGYLSVSGTYGSVDNEVCRVDFDEAWIRTFADNDESTEQGPYPDITSVPDSISKTLIRNIGRMSFIEPFAVFPVSYLDNDMIVFDFQLLGTRICARKEF